VTVVAEVPLRELVPVTSDQCGAAAAAIGALASAVVNVSGVYIADAVAHGDLARAGQHRVRGGRLVAQAVVGVEGREVPRNVGAKLLHHPAAHGLELFVRVVLVRNQQRRDLEPYVGLVLEVDERVEHRR
jgi:hypothetical protein